MWAVLYNFSSGLLHRKYLCKRVLDWTSLVQVIYNWFNRMMPKWHLCRKYYCKRLVRVKNYILYPQHKFKNFCAMEGILLWYQNIRFHGFLCSNHIIWFKLYLFTPFTLSPSEVQRWRPSPTLGGLSSVKLS